MSWNRLFYLLVALALLVTGGLTVISAINTMDVTYKLGALAHSKLENGPGVPPGQPPTIPPTPDALVNQEWLMGFALIGIVAFVIGWHLLRRSARLAKQKGEISEKQK